MNKRLAMLEKLTASPQADSFAFYCLGMEYRKEVGILLPLIFRNTT